MNSSERRCIVNLCFWTTIFVIAVQVLCLTSCNHTYDSLIEEYNKAFQMLSGVQRMPQPGDPDFNERDMLLEKYTVSESATLNLAAPHNCSRYNWSLYEVEQTNSINSSYSEKRVLNVRMSNGTSSATREFVCYIPTSNLKVDTYRLSLEVEGNDGVTYKDSCLVVIHRHVQ